MLKVGDYVMKSSEGVCKVDRQLMMAPYDSREEVPYYLLIPIKDGRSRVYVRAAESYSDIRPVMSAEEANALIKKIRDIAAAPIESERQREQVYKDALRSLNPERIVGIIKNMYERGLDRQRQGKKNTSVDDRYFKLAKETLYQELAFALGTELETIREMVRNYAETAS